MTLIIIIVLTDVFRICSGVIAFTWTVRLRKLNLGFEITAQDKIACLRFFGVFP
jgi:hypothetical protein